MKRIALFAMLLLSCIGSWAQEAQEEDAISADRPGMATGVDVLGRGKVQLEAGLEAGFCEGKYVTLPTAMLRYGLTRYAELRLQYSGALDGEDDWNYGADPLVIGTKVHVFDGRKWVPKISLMATLNIPTTRTMKREMSVAPQVYLLCHNDVTDWLSLDYNVGAEWDGYNRSAHTFLALCAGFALSDEWGAFAESYNYICPKSSTEDSSANVDFGFTYQPTTRLQLDAYAGLNCCEPRTAPFVGLGVAWRIN